MESEKREFAGADTAGGCIPLQRKNGDAMEAIWKLYKKYEEIVNYLIVGVLTTVVSWLAYALCKLVFDVNNAFLMQVAVVIRWIAGVTFGYFTNRRFVFKSRNPNMLKEAIDFTAGRVLTLFLDMFIMWLLPSVFHMNDWIATFISAVAVTVSNYILSKFFVFKKKKE